eukprot:gb/GECH01013030.1/.p1 GENE.gb/GECH01013030.1/~~gb/GECH01013030.1/.p1  ORF type:complete len:505 (+),score=166.28 gb/GECH01013030.1/:1-1515(+)
MSTTTNKNLSYSLQLAREASLLGDYKTAGGILGVLIEQIETLIPSFKTRDEREYWRSCLVKLSDELQFMKNINAEMEMFQKPPKKKESKKKNSFPAISNREGEDDFEVHDNQDPLVFGPPQHSPSKKMPQPTKQDRRVSRRKNVNRKNKNFRDRNSEKPSNNNKNNNKNQESDDEKKEKGGSDDKDSEENEEKEYKAATPGEQELVDYLHRDILELNDNIALEDIAGLANAKDLLKEALFLPLVRPDFFSGPLKRPWSGILMFGPPGTGKTLLAKAAASLFDVKFFNVSSATLTSKWRGESEKLVRTLFDMARFYAPSVIFIDEIDSLCSSRGGGNEHEASRRVKTEILTQMSGVGGEGGQEGKIVTVLGATNHPWDLDDAMIRRLEKRIYIPLPDSDTRKDLLNMSLAQEKLSDDVDIEKLAELTQGYSGHDITNVCRDASMMALRKVTKGLSPKELMSLSVEDMQLPLTLEGITASINKIQPSVGAATVRRYEQWEQEKGSQ